MDVDLREVIKIGAQAEAVAVAGAALVPAIFLQWKFAEKPWWKRIAAAVMPAAILAAYVAAFTLMYDFYVPETKDDAPWYLVPEAFKLIVFAAIACGILMIIARLLPPAGAIPVLLIMVAAAVLITIRGPWIARTEEQVWPNWRPLAIMLAAILPAYLLALAPAWKEERFWFLVSIVPWVACSAATVFMFAFDQTVSKFMVTTAILAGMAAVIGFVPMLRSIALGAGPMLVTLYAIQLTMVTRYNESQERLVPLAAVILLACVPLTTAVCWIPQLKKRPWTTVLIAGIAAILLAAPAVWMTVKHVEQKNAESGYEDMAP